MEKLAYLLWNSRATEAGPSDDALRDRLLRDLPAPLAAAGAERLKVCVTDSDVDRGAKLHLGKEQPAALVTFWLECIQDRATAQSVVASTCARLAGYLVVESQPLRTQTPKNGIGKRMPGFTLVGCIEPARGVSHRDFVERWETVHRDVAIETQSTFSYVRNEVVRPVTPDAPGWGGIVEEGFPLEALEDPRVFYDAVGDDALFQKNSKRMVESCVAFLDLEKVDSHPMSEYRFY